MIKKRTLRILGIRGIPASHGGFETFAEHLALHLVEKGWKVTVYQQDEGGGPVFSDFWNGIKRIHIPVRQSGPFGTIVFDARSVFHALRSRELCLTLGYNTAFLSVLFKFRRVSNIINMDGIEWARAKWGVIAKIWFWINEWIGCWLGTHLVADHPEIMTHLSSRVNAKKITTIAYGADAVCSAPVEILDRYGLQPRHFFTVIGRWEPENLILEVVRGFSSRHRGKKLVVLGSYDLTRQYHHSIMAAASDEVMFLGPIYDKNILRALRFYSIAYVHGHQVGGTNPSLVEALGAGNAILAHDNKFNRWVAGRGARFFADSDEFSSLLEATLLDEAALEDMRKASRKRFSNEFTWPHILAQYEALLTRFA